MNQPITRIVAAAATAAILAIYGSATGALAYPWAGTTRFAMLVTLEAATLAIVLRSRHGSTPSATRAVFAACLCLVALWFSAQDTLGAPEYVFMHQRWLVAAALGSLGLAAWAVVVRWRNARAVAAARGR
jgi:hypothetical protein